MVEIIRTWIKKEETWLEEFYPFVGLTHGKYLLWCTPDISGHVVGM